MIPTVYNGQSRASPAHNHDHVRGICNLIKATPCPDPNVTTTAQ